MVSSANEEDDPPILASESAAAIKSLKDEKSPGIDHVPAELLKKGGQTIIEAQNIYLEYIMMEASDSFEGSVSIGVRIVTNLRFADDIDLVAGQAEELSTLTRKL